LKKRAILRKGAGKHSRIPTFAAQLKNVLKEVRTGIRGIIFMGDAQSVSGSTGKKFARTAFRRKKISGGNGQHIIPGCVGGGRSEGNGMGPTAIILRTLQEKSQRNKRPCGRGGERTSGGKGGDSRKKRKKISAVYHTLHRKCYKGQWRIYRGGCLGKGGGRNRET